MKTIVLIFFFANILMAQTDWSRWQKAEVCYSTEQKGVEANHNHENSFSPLSILKDGYSFLISDLDGDNCPFYPTCSSFFVESVSETNLIKGTLMFADRFTRDSNLFKTHEHYPVHTSGRLYDPIHNYELNNSSVIYYSRDEIVK